MVSVEEASRIVFGHLCAPRRRTVSLAEGVGLVLAEPVRADRPLPPFDRVTMDGIAIAFESWKVGTTVFTIGGVQAAGEPPRELGPGPRCLEVMTGAMLPTGADTVIPYEDVRIEGGTATVASRPAAGQNVHREGSDAARGVVLLEPGLRLSPAEIAVLASVGHARVSVFDYPRTAIVSTGDELVDADETPAPWQLRRSNLYAIQAAMSEMKWPSSPFHIRDDERELEAAISRLLEENDVIILSGGVSKGKFDFVPQVLQRCGVARQFHQVRQRPGKPFWFGTSSSGKTVFALPGNPVSTYLCFYRYVKPWLERSAGIQAAQQTAILASQVRFEAPLTWFLPVAAEVLDGRVVAHPHAGSGSGDFANLRQATGFLELSPRDSAFGAGEVFPYIPFRR